MKRLIKVVFYAQQYSLHTEDNTARAYHITVITACRLSWTASVKTVAHFFGSTEVRAMDGIDGASDYIQMIGIVSSFLYTFNEAS